MLAIVNTLSTVANKVGFWTKQHAPEIMIVGGVVGGTAATVLACVATAKSIDDIGEAQAEIEAIEETAAKNDTYTSDDIKKDKRKVYMRLTKKLAVRYAPSVGLYVASTASILGGAGILNNRNTGLAMGLASSAASLKDIRDGLINEFGEEKGKELYNKFRYGITEEETKEVIYDGSGKKKVVKGKVKVIDPEANVRDICYTRRFDWTNPYYCRDDASYNLFFVRAQQNWANDKLRADGHLWMNTTDKALGFPETKPGQTVGWRYDPSDPNIDNFVDFNIVEAWDYDDYGNKLPILLLEYNVDGSILNKINWNE